MEERKMYFCYDLIKVSLCDAFLEKLRTDTTEDFFRCPLLSGAGPQGNLLSGVNTTERGRQGHSTADHMQEHCGWGCCCFRPRERDRSQYHR